MYSHYKFPEESQQHGSAVGSNSDRDHNRPPPIELPGGGANVNVAPPPGDHPLEDRGAASDDDLDDITSSEDDSAEQRRVAQQRAVDKAANIAFYIEHTVDGFFDDILMVSHPVLPVQTLVISFHIMQKRARQLLDDLRFFALQQFLWLLMSLVMILTPKGSTSRFGSYFSDVVFAACLIFSTAEMVIYIIGHGFFKGSKFGRSAQQLRVMSVLGVWSPPRFRRKGVVSSERFQIQTPLLSHPFLRVELVLVAISIIGYMIGGGSSWGKLRYLHGLRCSRLVYGLALLFPNLSVLIGTIQTSFAGLTPPIALLFFFFVLFGVAGLDQFSGSMEDRCVMIDPLLHATNYSRSLMCTGDSSVGDPLWQQCVEAVPSLPCDIVDAPTANSPVVCRGNMVCRSLPAPNHGFTSFSNIFTTTVLLIQVTSLTEWGDIMSTVWSSNNRMLVGIYFTLIVMIVYFVVLNFVVAIISSAYSEQRNLEERRIQTGSKTFMDRMSSVNFRITEFLWWTISVDAQYHLTYVPSGGKDRIPYHNHLYYIAGRDAWLVLLVVSHATNHASAGSAHESFLAAVEVINIIVFSLDVIVQVFAAGSLGKFLMLHTQRFEVFALVLTILGIAIKVPLSVFRSVLVANWLLKVPIIRRNQLIGHTLTATPNVLTACLVLGLSLFVSGAVAVQMFAVGGGSSAGDFEDSWESIVTMFRFVTLDGWSTVMYNSMDQNPVIGLTYFVPAYLMFGYVIRGIFTSVVVESFDPSYEEKLRWQSRGNKKVTIEEETEVSDPAAVSQLGRPGGVVTLDEATSAAAFSGIEQERAKISDNTLFLLGPTNKLRRVILQMITIPSELEAPVTLKIEENKEIDDYIPFRSYGNYFQAVVLLVVLGSCITAADPSTEACSTVDDSQKQVYSFTSYVALDAVFCAFFTVEMIIKMLARGVMLKGDDRPWYLGVPYFKDSWNLLDFFLLALMYVSFFYPQVSALRLLRILRPLRVLRRLRKMRLLIQAVVVSLPGLLVTLGCGAAILLLFAIVGVAKFKGKMYSCNVNEIGDLYVVTKGDCAGVQMAENGVLVHAAWQLLYPNFENVINAMGYLVQVISLSSWTTLLSRATSVVGVDMQPKPKVALVNSIYFFVFVILANYFVMNVVVGVFVAAFDEQRGMRYLTLKQKMYRSLQEAAECLKPIPPFPSSSFPRLLAFVTHSWFDIVLNIVVLLNVVVMATAHSDQSVAWDNAQFVLNAIFTFVFLVEAILKILALGRHYFLDAWNDVDFLIVAGSLVEFSVQLLSSNRSVTVTSIGRTFRILRVFRSVRRVPSLHHMFLALVSSAPAVLSIFCIMIMFIFMYAVVGMSILGQLRFQTYVAKNANFRGFDIGWFTVFRMFTLDGWDMMMKDVTSYVAPYCHADVSGMWYLDPTNGEAKACGLLNDCSNVAAGQFYFFSFFVISAFFFSNVVVAILLDSFRLTSSGARASVRREDLEGFRVAWLAARRPLGQSAFYGFFLEKELMSLLCIALFNDSNGLVMNRHHPELHVHPVLTSKSRMNFRKVLFELDCVASRRRHTIRQKERRARQADEAHAFESSPTVASFPVIPRELEDDAASPIALNDLSSPSGRKSMDEYPENTYEFHDVVECLCRFQMGDDALTLDQRQVRERFLDKMNVALFGNTIKLALKRRLMLAKRRISVFGSLGAYDMTADPTGELFELVDNDQHRVNRNVKFSAFDGEHGDGHDVGDSAADDEAGKRFAEGSSRRREAIETTSPPRSSWEGDGAVGDTALVPLLTQLWNDEADGRYGLVKDCNTAFEMAFRRILEVTEDDLWETLTAQFALGIVAARAVAPRAHVDPTASQAEQSVMMTRGLPSFRYSTPPTQHGGAPQPSVSALRVPVPPTECVGGQKLEAMRPSIMGNPFVEAFGMMHYGAPRSEASQRGERQRCPLDRDCPDYLSTSHCAQWQHSCRRGRRCKDFRSDHLRQYLHSEADTAPRDLREA